MDPDRFQMKDVKRRLATAERTLKSTSESLNRWKARFRKLEEFVNVIHEELQYMSQNTFVRAVDNNSKGVTDAYQESESARR